MSSWELDTDADALYVTLREGSVASQLLLSDRLIVDVDAAGTPLGVEVLAVSRGWDVAPLLARVSLPLADQMLLTLLSATPPGVSRVASAGLTVRVHSGEVKERGVLRSSPLAAAGAAAAGA